MSKRRINKQQTARIHKTQASYRLKTESDLSEGLVLTRYSRHAIVEDRNGNRLHCSIRPHIDSLVAGDRIVWQQEGKNQGVIVSRYTRQSMLGRPDKQGNFRPVAANITQIMVVIAVKPELTWPLLDSYLVMAESLGLQACIVLNKIDLPCASLQKELSMLYEPLGYSILHISKYNNEGYESLKATLNQQTSVFVGQSGVGKSSIIAEILPHEANIQVAEISSNSELGCHTTSNSRLYHLPTGGELIDSPGVRELGLWHLSIAEVMQGFRELRPLVSQCKFRNCNHQDSPGCAILTALNAGKLSEKRYASFVKLSGSAGKSSSSHTGA